MNLNELKNRCQAVKAPALPPATRDAAQPLNGLIGKLKALEAKEAQQFRKARPLWLIAAVAFLLMFLALLGLPAATVTPARLWFGGVLGAVFLLNAVLLERKLGQLARIDYGESLHSFLDKAEARHRFMGPQERWLAGSGLVVLGVVSGAYFHDTLLRRHVGPDHQALGIALYCLGYLAVCAAGFTFTYRDWKRDKAPLLAEIQQLKQELTANEVGTAGEADRSGQGI